MEAGKAWTEHEDRTPDALLRWQIQSRCHPREQGRWRGRNDVYWIRLETGSMKCFGVCELTGSLE